MCFFFFLNYEFYARINSLTNTAGIQTLIVLFTNNQFFGSVDIGVHPNTPIGHVRFSPKWPNVSCTSQAKDCPLLLAKVSFFSFGTSIWWYLKAGL
jgi:hypothetical protein